MSEVVVIIPAHRVDSWLDEAVRSALESTGAEPDVVVVLNGTTERPAFPWVDSPRVDLVHEVEPLGPTRAMIRGIQASDSTFVARLDADDRMSPDRIAAQVAYLREHPETPLVGTAVGRITEKGAPAGRIEMPTGRDVRRHLVLSNTVTHSSVLLRREVLTDIGGYDPALAQMEDYDVILRMAQRGPIAVLPEELTEYRLHAGQISRGAAPTGPHIRAVIAQRSRLGAVLGMPRIGVLARNALWRGVQFARYWGVIKPGHEY